MKTATAICVSAAIALAACATVKESHAPDGRKAFTINCSGAARGWDKCYQAAGEKCTSKGYDILDRTGEITSSYGAGGNSSGWGASGSTNAERSMMVACKP